MWYNNRMKKVIISAAMVLLASCGSAMAIDSEVSCLAQNIYHEARNQTIVGQIAVGQVTLNRVGDPRFPDTICEVVTEGPHRPSWKDPNVMIPVKNLCQFSWYCDGKSDEIRNFVVYQEIVELAEIMIRYKVLDITSGATHYHANYVTPAWAQTMTRTAKIEDHIFYRWETQ
jgi:spore germination cell wall hydrolase CwlJ-like protein